MITIIAPILPPNAQIRIVQIEIATFKPKALAMYRINKPITAWIARRSRLTNKNLNKSNATIIATTNTIISVNTMIIYWCF